MGRKSVVKKRIDDQGRKTEWAARLLPAFQEKGLKRFSMNDAAAFLNISKATLYKYFSSRQEILECMIGWKIDQLGGVSVLMFDKKLSFIDRFLNSHRLSVREMSGISGLFLADLKSLYPEIWKQIDQFMDETIQLLETFYKEGIATGEFNDINPAVLVLTDRLFLKSLGDPELLKSHLLEPSEAIEAYFLMKFRGIFKKDVIQNANYSGKIKSFLEDLSTN